jgi:hypothetical protein
MSSSTRRIVFLSLLVLLLTIPAELVLLRALAEPDQNAAVRTWAASRSETELQSAAANIQSFPVLYRREIMRALEPVDRVRVWRSHLLTYVQTRPSLDTNAAALIVTVAGMLTPDMFVQATEEQRASVKAIAEQIQTLIGPADARFLLERLGPEDGTFASFEPMAMYLSNKVRGVFVGLAQSGVCDCSQSHGCYGFGSSCSGALSCAEDFTWPACGWFWGDPCNGLCVAGW